MAAEATLLDTSILLQATFSDLPRHDAAWALLNRARNGEGDLCVCVHSLAELGWLISDATIVAAPDTPDLAARKLKELLGAAFLRKLPVTAGALWRQAELIERHALMGPRTLDALVVAVMMEHDVSWLYTLHPREFAAFTAVRAVNPFA